MPKSNSLLRVGTRVKIILDQVRDRIPTNLINQINNDPRGKIIGYKMTDGTGIGFVLELSNGTTSWFFETEIGRN